MDKRYQVFVSSTFTDLVDERKEVMHALLELDCFPAGMELFPAADESQWELIKRVIDDSDYYVLILAGRYGSLGPDGISYTEMEYRYALEKKKPVIAFLHKNPDSIAVANAEKTDDGKAKLGIFKEDVSKRLCKYWSTPSELGSVVSRSLIQLIKQSPGIGWVRANQIASNETASEILRLRDRIMELETELANEANNGPSDIENLEQGNDSAKINFSYKIENLIDDEEIEVNETYLTTWDKLFADISPNFIEGAHNNLIESKIQRLIYETQIKVEFLSAAYSSSSEHYLPSNYFVIERHVNISKFDMQTILLQFTALGLITNTSFNLPESNSYGKWQLTPHGHHKMLQLRALKRKR